MKAQLNPWSSKWTIQLYRGHTIICYTNKIASVLTSNERKTAIDLHPSYASIFVQFEHLNHNNIVCMCVFFPFICSGRQACWTYQPGYTGGRSHWISHSPSLCGSCLNFSREKDSAVPFPRRPRSRILCANKFIVLHLLDIFIFIFYFLVRKNPIYRDSNSRPNVSEGFEVTN